MSGPHLTPLSDEAIDDPELIDLIHRCEALGVPDPQLPRIVARVPEQAKPMLGAVLESYAKGDVPHRLKELIRLQMANAVRDPYFSALRSAEAGLGEDDIAAALDDYEDSDRFTDAEKVAMAFAEQMFLDSTKVDADFYDELKEHYTEPQIMEIGAFIAIWQGVHLFAKTLGLRAPVAG